MKFLRGSRFYEKISGVRGPNFTKLGQGTRPSCLLTEFVSELRYLGAFSNAEASNLSDVKNEAIFDDL